MRAEPGTIQGEGGQHQSPAGTAPLFLVQPGVETEQQQVVGEPVRAHRVVPQDDLLLKAKPLEQASRTSLIRRHAGDDFRHLSVQCHLKHPLQQESADADAASRFRDHHAQLGHMAGPAHAPPVVGRIAHNVSVLPGHNGDKTHLVRLSDPPVHLGGLGDVPLQEEEVILRESPGKSNHRLSIFLHQGAQDNRPALENKVHWKVVFVFGR